MDLRQLTYFLGIADTKSFTQAAILLRVTQPALSRQMRDLEEELNAPLFERHVRGIKMTDAGKILYKRATSILEVANSVNDEIAAILSEPAGELIVAMPAAFRDLISKDLILSYKRRYPQVRLCVQELTTIERRDAVIEGHANLAVTTTMDPEEGLHVVPLINEGLFIAGSRERAFCLSNPEKLEHVSELPLIQNTHPNAMRIIVDAALSRAGLQSRTEIEVDAIDMMIELARNDEYCIIAPYTAIHGHVQDGTLSAAPVNNLRVTWQVVTSNSRPVSVAARVFNEMLAARCHALVKSKMWKTGKLLYQEGKEG